MTLIQTNRLGLPLLAAGQAQKEVAHNEALLLLDLIGQPVVESADLATPPVSPTPGQCWIAAAPASGDWAGMAGAIAGWTDSGWRFTVPAAGWAVQVLDRGHGVRFDGSDWIDEPMRDDGYFVAGERVLASRQAAIADPVGGATMDVQSRFAIIAILTALRAHGLIEA